jgi:hypothetical protein
VQTVISKDGSRIAYDRYGSGPTVILVGGALGYRKFKKMEELAQLLAERCTVINYDRRGRGDSTEVKPFALEREIEDIQGLIDAEGGSASLWVGRRAARWRCGQRGPQPASSASPSTRCRSWSHPRPNGRRRTTANGSTSSLRPATEPAPSSTSCATRWASPRRS